MGGFVSAVTLSSLHGIGMGWVGVRWWGGVTLLAHHSVLDIAKDTGTYMGGGAASEAAWCIRFVAFD